ncbi:hypothetical protein [Vibrio cortegadensis]|uniref:Uncharacterized protein n=1 Tax=Vibrio cortegadensis TaxID=1328770 RepID=A0ABV4M4U0_9VIBR
MKRKRITQNKAKLSQRQRQAKKNSHPANLYMSTRMSLVLDVFTYMEECFNKSRAEETHNMNDDTLQDSFEIAFSEPLTQPDMIIAIHQDLQYWQKSEEDSSSYTLLLETQSRIERLFPFVRSAEPLKTIDLEWCVWEQICAVTQDYSLRSCGTSIYKRPEAVAPVMSANEQVIHDRQVADFFNKAGIKLDE